MKLFSIDPGTEKSAFVRFDSRKMIILEKGILVNGALLEYLKRAPGSLLIIEQIKSYGMPMGDTTIETCVWIGRFIEAWRYMEIRPHVLIPRKTVCSILCYNARANDSHVRQRLIDYFGPGKEKAIGKKSKPGPLYGISKDIWSALGIAVAWIEKDKEQQKDIEDVLT